MQKGNSKQLTEEEKILQEENIPGLTICGQDHELELLQELQEHFDNLNKNEPDSDYKRNKTSGEKVNLLNDVEIETANERNIRLGMMTPFGTVLNARGQCAERSGILKYLHQEKLRGKNKNIRITNSGVTTSSTNRNRKTRKKITISTETVECTSKSDGSLLSEQVPVNFDESSESEYVPSSFEESEEENDTSSKKLEIRDKCKRNKSSDDYVFDSDRPYSSSKYSRTRVFKEIDDGNEDEYQHRLEVYEKSCDTTNQMFHEVTEGSYFQIPLEIWSKLYNYQKVGVQWLWELHQQGTGGILADEMGLGKTIQLISFLSGLYYSKLKNKNTNFRGLGPSIIICPTTLMYQWVKEFHIWCPPVRVAVLHACGSFSGRKGNLIRDIYRGKGILIASYSSMVQDSEEILRYGWHYAILDEGHKIRNPDAKVTLAVKQFKTPHRLILSGSPLQNNLVELWSLFDFVYPGKLGELPMFQAQFAIPITHGGYANASDIEVTIACKCATVLKELISPHLLRRSKTDVKSHIKLPEKNEQVLFCQLTDCQKALYKSYIESGEVYKILEGQAQIFVGIINLRKICNHPDLYSGGPRLIANEKEEDLKEEDRFGHWEKSGKMLVLRTLLRIWYKQNHKVLLFTQSRQMLNILEVFLKSCNYSYLKLDGRTYIGSRQPLIEKFNTDSTYFIMLLTTKVGGLGVNLTGANRIVIFDPDWNPATDTQARERAWRIGQTKDVTIYRLISVGTIEEKMYHRQIFKQFLTNKVLKDPKQRRFFKSNDLFELFTLKESNVEGSTETGAIFAGTGSEINRKILKLRQEKEKKKLKRKLKKEFAAEIPIQFSASKVEKMKQIAQRISQKLSQQIPTKEHNTGGEKGENYENRDENENVQTHPSPSRNSFVSSHIEVTEAGTANVSFKSRKKKHRKSFFEGEHVPYLVSYKKAKVKVDHEQEEDVKTVDDEYVLKKLFSKTGICSALQHDTIMEGGPADFAIVEKEAERIAQQAINELKRSEEQCFPARTGIPNWTGKNGIRAKIKPVSKGLTSTEILEKIKKRNGETETSSSELRILKELHKFITSEGGTATTDRLIETFQKNLPSSATPLFKSLLTKICSFYRGPDGKGYWTLKNEFLT